MAPLPTVVYSPRSMTAFAQVAAPGLRLEAKSVNQRFLDVSLKVPDALRSYEAALRQLCGQHIRRGKVELRLTWGAAAVQPEEGNVVSGVAGEITDPKLLWRSDTAAYLQALQAQQSRILAALPGTAALGTADVLKLIEQLHAQSDASEQGVPEVSAVLAAVGELLAQFNAAREAEGAALCAAVTVCLDRMEQLVQEAERLVPQQQAAFAARFTERWQQVLGYVRDDAKNSGQMGSPSSDAHSQPTQQTQQAQQTLQERQVAELTAFAVRSDVAEEVTRLSAHIAEVRRLLAQGGELGKRLDFMCQELLREANTLGSKSASLELTRVSVDLKVYIEQIKEQVQNIE